MKTKTYQNTLLKDVEKVNLFARVGDKQIKTNLFGVYSPSVDKVIIDCTSKFTPTTNKDFINSIENIASQHNLDIEEFFSLSDGGKMCAWLSFNDFYNQFEIPTKLKRNKQKVNLSAKLYVIETNDTSTKLQVGLQLIINEESAFLINDNTTISSYRSSIPFDVRKQELPILINNVINNTNEFILTLNELYLLESDLNIETEKLKNIFTKNENTSEKMLVMMSEVESNSHINKNLFGENYLSLAIALGYFLLNKHDLFIEKNLENYLFSTLKKKNDLIINTLKNISKNN